MAIYTCGKCAFTFQRSGPVEACPNCENGYIRAASDEEAEKYYTKLAEDKCKDQPVDQ